MNYTLNKAAKLCGRSKSTLSNAIKNGRLSANKDEQGRYSINAAELHRVFPLPAQDQSQKPIQNTDKTIENRELSAKIEAQNHLIETLEATCQDLRQRLDEESSERRVLTRMLTERAHKPVERPSHGFGWFGSLLAKKPVSGA